MCGEGADGVSTPWLARRQTRAQEPAVDTRDVLANEPALPGQSPDFPEGLALNLADSICRARYRREPDPIEPGEVYAFDTEPCPTTNVFGEGHRIRLDVSSSNYPRCDVNHNTGGPLCTRPGGWSSKSSIDNVFLLDR